VPLSPKAFDLLGTLLAARPDVLTTDDLMKSLWPDTYVVRTSVARVVNEVRKALADDAEHPRFIRTAHRVGYAFMGEAVDDAGAPPPPPSTCRLHWGPVTIPLRDGENILGRAAEAVVSIPSPKVSRRHAAIRVDGTRAFIEDLGSRNGTYLAGNRISARQPLADGDEITIGPVTLIFASGAEDALTRD
jgi:hypothetical protein